VLPLCSNSRTEPVRADITTRAIFGFGIPASTEQLYRNSECVIRGLDRDHDLCANYMLAQITAYVVSSETEPQGERGLRGRVVQEDVDALSAHFTHLSDAGSVIATSTSQTCPLAPVP
jgi:hypothetical protein